MKELILFRIFALFPFIGVLIPDISNKLYSSATHISAEHLIVEVTLFICVIICSAGIMLVQEDSPMLAMEDEDFMVAIDAQALKKVHKTTEKHGTFPRKGRVSGRSAGKTSPIVEGSLT